MELTNLLPLVVAGALASFALLVDRQLVERADPKAKKWNDYVA